jgi:hypothetical protein
VKAPASVPIHQARIEKLRLMRRATGRRRSERVAISCAICEDATTITRKNSRKAPRPV